MTRKEFLELLKEFDDNYISGGDKNSLKEYFENEAKENNQTLKECLKNKDSLNMYSQIDRTRLHNLVMDNDKLFKDFYHLDKDTLEVLFYNLHITDLFLKYYQEYRFDRLRTYASRQLMIKKYKGVIEDLKITTSITSKEIERLENRIKGLKIQPTITEQRIFQNLLYWVAYVLADKNTKDFKVTNKIANITNQIIELYYQKDSNFSKQIKLGSFTDYHYTIESALPIILMHSWA